MVCRHHRRLDHRHRRSAAHPGCHDRGHNSSVRYGRALALSAQGDRRRGGFRPARGRRLLAGSPESMNKAVRFVLVLIALPAPALAQRAPVLRQIKVPHSYYFREMYLPQVTSGPSSVTWSPDGTELIYSMQGSLWRQRLGSEEAKQLTAGGGYDYQPDWSPDGASVVFSSYRNDAIELRLLDLTSGDSRSLLADSAVSVEPRWSPDGTRIAFVSTAYEGRWHIFVAPFQSGRLGTPERITEDRDSGLPRYYYGVRDQYLSPT